MRSSFGKHYYDQNYANYGLQNPLKKIAFYKNLAELCRPARDCPEILDMGCAFGLFLQALGDRWDRYGLDVSEYAVAKAVESIPEARFAVSSAEDIPYDTKFDVITAFDCLEHVPDLDRVASVVDEKLAPEGHFVFVVPVYDGPLGSLVRLLDKDPTHIHKLSRWTWLDWANSRFHLENWLGVYRYLLPTGHYIHRPSKKHRRFAPAVAIIACKR